MEKHEEILDFIHWWIHNDEYLFKSIHRKYLLWVKKGKPKVEK